MRNIVVITLFKKSQPSTLRKSLEKIYKIMKMIWRSTSRLKLMRISDFKSHLMR
jgi:hypothetical protein